jgi:hypothetical protein
VDDDDDDDDENKTSQDDFDPMCQGLSTLAVAIACIRLEKYTHRDIEYGN